MKILLLTFALVGLFNSQAHAQKIQPVDNFMLEKYLGTWYEVARLDHFFERHMNNVQAQYSMRDDGKVKVVNSGYSEKKAKWKDATGKAYLKQSRDIGHLKVSFFGPFYADYIVFELGENYEYAFVAGSSKKYLWLLSRTPAISPELKQHFLSRANQLGFNTDKLIWVDQQAAQNTVTNAH